MVPTILVYLPKLPLTYNGKLDRKALPEPEFGNSRNYTLPSNKVESKVCEIWAEILGLSKDKVGIDDDFFRLGGNSILLIKLVSTINNEFESNVKFKEIFNSSTIRQIAELIQNSIGHALYKDYQLTKIDEVNLYHTFSLNNVQQAYYLGRFSNFELGDISTHTYMLSSLERINHVVWLWVIYVCCIVPYKYLMLVCACICKCSNVQVAFYTYNHTHNFRSQRSHVLTYNYRYTRL
ncbi:MAG: hypothetical protein EOO43_23145 [Flavobacterium sp.]|nr:MAG: hypothetical protein EOO43_23145 [Flavobacterium sp.]